MTPDEMRAVMGRFATGVTVVTTAGPLGSTANAVSSVSLDPPLVLVCLREESQTLTALQASGAFAINVLAEDQQELADRFAQPASDAQWAGVAHELAAGGAPLLEGTLATIECTVHEEARGGDHRIVIGRVRSVRLAEEPPAPLLFSEARYHGLGDELARAETTPTVPLPSRLGDLEVAVREWGDDGAVSMVATVGEPREGAALYVHRGCIVGDLLASCCGSRSTLHAALRGIGPGGAVVYHRPPGAQGACAAAGGTAVPGELGEGAVRVALAAAAELRLGSVRLLTNGHDEHRRLAAAGLDVASAEPLSEALPAGSV